MTGAELGSALFSLKTGCHLDQVSGVTWTRLQNCTSIFGRTSKINYVLTRRDATLRDTRKTHSHGAGPSVMLKVYPAPPFAGIFMMLEGWSPLQAIYYSFITLTTIGFGDLVAGKLPTRTEYWEFFQR